MERELGHQEILDRFSPYGNALSRAIPASPLLHIMSGNTPHAALQSLIRGLLLGAENRLKLPSAGLPEVEQFCHKLPEALRRQVKYETALPDAWLEEAAAIIVFGSDETMETFRKKAGDRIFLPHGHKISLGIVFEDADFSSVAEAAKDICQFDQLGCLSCQCLYVSEIHPGDAKKYAELLGHAMAEFEKHSPRRLLEKTASAEIFALRSMVRFQMAEGKDMAIWESPGSDAWTVIYESAPEFSGSCLNRVIYVKPLAEDMREVLAPLRPWLSTMGIWPATESLAIRASAWGATRICRLGTMQNPSVFWHQDGKQVLAPLIQWIDFDASFV